VVVRNVKVTCAGYFLILAIKAGLLIEYTTVACTRQSTGNPGTGGLWRQHRSRLGVHDETCREDIRRACAALSTDRTAKGRLGCERVRRRGSGPGEESNLACRRR
jgi:hypothetical protein